MKGLSITLVFGSWGGIYITASKTAFRICLGYVAFTIYFLDLERAIEGLSQ